MSYGTASHAENSDTLIAYMAIRLGSQPDAGGNTARTRPNPLMSSLRLVTGFHLSNLGKSTCAAPSAWTAAEAETTRLGAPYAESSAGFACPTISAGRAGLWTG